MGLWFVVHNVFVARELWFWWDELTIIESSEKGLTGITHGHFGNFFPLFRILFIGEVEIFKNTYWMYILINSILVLLLAGVLGFLAVSLRPSPGLGFNQLLFAIFICVSYLFSDGTLYTVQWAMMQKWHISVLLVVVGAIFGSKSSYPFSFLMTASFISSLFMSSAALATSLVGLSVLTIATSGTVYWKDYSVLKSFCVVVASGGLSFLGYFVANQNPSEDSSTILPEIPELSIQLFVDGVEEALLGTLLWIYKPIISMASNLEETRLILLGSTNPDSFAYWRTIALLLVLPIIFLKWVLRNDLVRGVAALLSGSAVLLIQIQIVGRGQGTWLQTNLENRYDPLLLFAVFVFWMALIQALTRILLPSDDQKRSLHLLVGIILIVMVGHTLRTGIPKIATASNELRRNEQPIVIHKLTKCSTTTDFSAFKSIQVNYQDKICHMYKRISED